MSLTMMFTLVPTAMAADAEAGTASEPELENPATEGTSGGIDWKVESGTLTITPSNSPESDYTKGQMVENYGTLTKNASEDAAYIAALTAAGYTPGSNGHFYYPNTETWVSDSPWKFLSDQITKVVVEDGVTSIAARAFRLPNVTEVSIPASVASIGNLVFESCVKLTTVNWTGDWSRHTPMAFNGFSRCSSLGNGYELTDWMPACFYVNADSDSIEGTQFTVDFDKLNGRLQDGTTYPRAMFRSVPKITSATLTSQLNNEYIFEYSGIQSVTIADDQTSIATAAFRGCEGLTSVVIPGNVTEIKLRAFGGSGLKSITFSGLTSPTFGTDVFENVKLDSLTLNENMSMAEAVKIIGELAREKAITDSTTITPAKFANFNAENVVVDGAEGEAINRQSYPLVKNLTINGAYTSAVGAFGNSVWGKETLEALTIHAPGNDVTINATAFLRTPLQSVKIETKNLTFTGDAAFLNTMILTRVDLTGVDQIMAGEGAKRTFELNTTGDYGNLNVPTRYVYFKNADTYNALAQGDPNKHFRGNTNTYYLVTNGGTVVGEQDGFSAVVKGGYTAEWHGKADFSDTAVETPEAGKVYYANWTKSNSVALTSNPAAGADGKVSETYTPSGAVTLSVQNPGAGWLYSWMKNGEQITAAGNSLTLYTPSESGIYSVQVTTKGNNALIWTSNEINVTITKADGTASVSLSDWTYGETASEPVPTSDTNGINNVTYQYKVKGADDTTYSDTLPINAGDYTVKATFAATDNYNEVTATDDFTITKATYNMTGVKFEDASYTYDGSEKTLTISGTLPTDVTVAYENNKLTNAGSVTAKAKFTIADSNNYCAIKDMTATLTITKAKPTVSISAKPDSLRGGGKVTLTVTGVPEEGNVIVTCDNGITVDNANGTYSAVLPNRTVDYTFTLNYTGVENGNYSDATDTCTVSVTRRHTSSVTPGNTVSVPSTPNGTVTVSPSTASKGETVTITTKPSEGYELGSIEVLDKNGDSLKLKDLGNGKYSFVMPDGKVSVEAEFVKTAATSFADVPANAYFADAVKWAVDKGITNGLSDTMFGPYESCTRAQIVTFLWRAAGSPKPKTASSFTDVPVSTYYAKAVAWAVENGITNGMTETTFAPDEACTRGQSVTFLHRALKGTASGSVNFTDVPANAFYTDAVNWAVANNVTNGTSNTTFSPNADCTRAEIVTFLYRAYQGK
ncbi:MAG: hypothetical protein BHV93_13960 [Clostridiales bacterium 52_15]|nr:MAG: hypothetical protein BHV93_13960 [Clostridiales bacterium 52_15]